MSSYLFAELLTSANLVPSRQRTTTRRRTARLERHAFLRPEDAHLGRQLVEQALAAIKDPQGEGSRTFLSERMRARPSPRPTNDNATRLSDVACQEGAITALQSAEPHDVGLGSLIGIGGRLAAPPLPHHLAYGSPTSGFDRVELQLAM